MTRVVILQDGSRVRGLVDLITEAPRTTFSPPSDRKTVNQTCINGPQWFMRDFAVQVEEAENTGVAASSEKVPAELVETRLVETNRSG